MGKITKGLKQLLERSGKSELVTCVVWLPEIRPTPGRPRNKSIAELKAKFAVAAAPIESAVAALNGEVLGYAWIDQRLMIKLPAENVQKLADVPGVKELDIPRAIQREA